LERRAGVAGARVALADLGQLDDPAVLLEQARRAGVGDELACPALRVLESGRVQVLVLELGDELVEPDAVAGGDRPQEAMGIADAGGRDGTHRRTLTGRARPCKDRARPCRAQEPVFTGAFAVCAHSPAFVVSTVAAAPPSPSAAVGFGSASVAFGVAAGAGFAD